MSDTTGMDLAKLKEPFSLFDIEWRIQSSGIKNTKPWGMVLAYVTARAIQNRLDEACGPDKWRVEYAKGPDGGVLCGISIKCGEEWVCKWDGAENTNIEAVKGGISSALKRAGSVWGIGRYLYGLKTTWAIFDAGGEYNSKIENGWHKWNPPKLPPWALPKEEANKNQKQDDTKKDEAETAKNTLIQRINIMVKELGIDRDEKLVRVNKVISRDVPVKSTSELTTTEAEQVIEALKLAKEKANV